jgi:acetyltransferase-like isoleucine patch superfamily enzyme
MREAFKATARGAALVAVLPSLFSYWLRRAVLGPDRALEGSSQALSLIPGLPGQYLRRAFLAQVLAGCGRSTVIAFGTILSKAGARLDEGVYVGPGCYLGLVHLEENVLVGSGVHITSGRHTHGTADPDAPIRDQQGASTLVRVGAGSWIGSAAVVMADVGRNSIVGAGAVVAKPVPDSVVAAGVPAVVVRQRS